MAAMHSIVHSMLSCSLVITSPEHSLQCGSVLIKFHWGTDLWLLVQICTNQQIPPSIFHIIIIFMRTNEVRKGEGEPGNDATGPEAMDGYWEKELTIWVYTAVFSLCNFKRYCTPYCGNVPIYWVKPHPPYRRLSTTITTRKTHQRCNVPPYCKILERTLLHCIYKKIKDLIVFVTTLAATYQLHTLKTAFYVIFKICIVWICWITLQKFWQHLLTTSAFFASQTKETDGLFSRRLVCRSSNMSYKSTDSSLVIVSCQLRFLAVLNLLIWHVAVPHIT